MSQTGFVTCLRPGDIPITITSGDRASEIVPRWARPPPLPIPMLSRQSTTWVTLPIGILPGTLNYGGAAFLSRINKPENLFVSIRSISSVIGHRRFGLHVPSLLDSAGESFIGKDFVYCLLDAWYIRVVLELQNDCSDLYLELDVLVSNVDDLAVGMGVGLPPCRPVRNCSGKVLGR